MGFNCSVIREGGERQREWEGEGGRRGGEGEEGREGET